MINLTKFCCWSEYFFRREKLFRGENSPLVWKMESRQHHMRSRRRPILHYCLGNRTLTSHLSLRLFLAASRGQSVRGWPVHPAEFLSDRGRTMREFQLLPLVSLVWLNVGALRHQMFAPSPSSSVGNGWITGMADRILACSVVAYQDFGFVK